MDDISHKRIKKSYFPGMKKSPVYNLSHSSSERNVYDRRPLRSMSLKPPDYQIDLQLLLEDYIEKEIRYAGLVADVSVDVDVTNRTEILKLIDRGKKQGNIPWHTTFEQDAIFSLCAHNIKMSRRHGEDLLLRIPIHEIAAICYIRDDGQHILALKHGDPDKDNIYCSLAVLYSDSKSSAEEICALVAQCFQLVYTDATMQFFDQELRLASGMSTTTSSTTQSDSSTIIKQRYDPCNPSFLTRSNPDLRSNQSSTMSRTIPRSHRTPSTASELSAPSTELLQDYLKKLHTKLTSEELKQFAILLKARHTNLAFNEFCDKVLSLFGASRKHLMAGMWPFIGERDYSNFEEFLERYGIGMSENGRGSSSSYTYALPYMRRTSESSMQAGVVNGSDLPVMSGEDFERLMDHIEEFEKESSMERPASTHEPIYMSISSQL